MSTLSQPGALVEVDGASAAQRRPHAAASIATPTPGIRVRETRGSSTWGSVVPSSPTAALHEVWEAAEEELKRLVAALGAGPNREDVLQDVYLAALRENSGNDDKVRERPADELRRWLFRVAINRCHLEHRRRASWRRVLTGVWNWNSSASGGATEAADASQTCAARQEETLVREALEKLEPDLKTPLVLRYFCDLDSTEIGQIMQLPDSTVRSRLRAARKKLAAGLTAVGYEPE